MINEKKQPVEWALLLYEFGELQEHLNGLVEQLSADGECEDEEYAVRMGHLYAHLNRLWNARNHCGEISDREFLQFSEFPTDIDPVG